MFFFQVHPTATCLRPHFNIAHLLHVVKVYNVQHMGGGLLIVLLYSHIEFSGTFAKLKNATINFVKAVLLSMRMEQLTGRISMKFDI